MISYEIFYAALNFKDVMMATGKIIIDSHWELPTVPSTNIGLEFSGLANGKRVMGMCEFGGIALQGKTSKDMIWEIPDQWSLEDAATVPTVYSTVRKFYRFSQKNK